MNTRMVGALWVVAGASFVGAATIVALVGPTRSLGALGAIVVAIGSIGAFAFVGAVLGLVWHFRERLGRLSALAGGVAALGMLLGVIEVPPGVVLLPLGSAVLVWDLARAQAISRGLAIVFGLSAIVLLFPMIGALFGINDTAAIPQLAALGLPYLLSWIALGVSLLRGVPTAQAPLTST
jgi:hypothetical protein